MMKLSSVQNPFHCVEKYPPELLKNTNSCVQVPVTYKKVWNDGFGARGWKVNVTIGDPEIIASTRETGQKINTSVFIHDILDHFLSGFSVSGHRSEAMAHMQLSKRTGSDPSSDYEQLIREDILHGRVNGAKLLEFLPTHLCSILPKNSGMTNKKIIKYLIENLGEKHLTNELVEHFFKLGKAGESHAT